MIDRTETPDETPIISVIIVLGLLSYLATFAVIELQDKLLLFDITALAGLICGLIALPLGLTLSNIKLKVSNTTFSVS